MAAMALSSTSTRDQVLDEYANNANYVVTGSTTEAKAFIAACTQLLSPRFSPKRMSHGGRGAEEVELDLETIRLEKHDAAAWLNIHNDVSAGGAGVKHVDFSAFRD